MKAIDRAFGHGHWRQELGRTGLLILGVLLAKFLEREYTYGPFGSAFGLNFHAALLCRRGRTWMKEETWALQSLPLWINT
jgi:hypothetical protein